MLLRQEVVGPVTEILEGPEDFYRPANGLIYAAICDLRAAGEPVDMITVAHALRRDGQLDRVGGEARLVELQVRTGSTTRAPAYAVIIAETARARRLVTIGHKITTAAFAGDTMAALEVLGEVLTIVAGRAADDWEDVAAVMRGEAETITPTMFRRTDGACLVYPGQSHWIMGEPGKGKTWIALHLVAEVIADERPVIYLDWEGNRSLVGERLLALGLEPEQVGTLLSYKRPGGYTPSTKAAIEARCQSANVALVVIDGVAKALAARGINEDSAPEVLTWWETVIAPLCEAGAAVLALDHVTKEREGRALWARGSGAKLGEVSGAAWMVVPRQNFSRSTPGRLDLKQAKDRLGYNAADGEIVACIDFAPSDAGALLSVTVNPPAGVSRDEPWEPTHIMESISQLLETANTSLSGSKIEQSVQGRARWIREALKLLAHRGFVTMHTKGNGTYYRHRTPFRAPDDVDVPAAVGAREDF